MKLISSVAGVVTMADGTTRPAYRNTYKSLSDATLETRIELRLFTNANTSRNSKWRKASIKQAGTFQEA